MEAAERSIQQNIEILKKLNIDLQDLKKLQPQIHSNKEQIDLLKNSLKLVQDELNSQNGAAKADEVNARLEALKEMIGALNKEVENLKGKMGPELETKLTLILKNRDDMLRRIEVAEQDTVEIRKQNHDLAEKIDKKTEV